MLKDNGALLAVGSGSASPRSWSATASSWRSPRSPPAEQVAPTYSGLRSRTKMAPRGTPLLVLSRYA